MKMPLVFCSMVMLATGPGCGDDDGTSDSDGGGGDGGGGDGGGATDFGMAKTFNVMLTAAMEVPPCDMAGASAAGSGAVTINAQGSSIEVSALMYSGLSGNATVAHIHAGPAGMIGPLVLTLGTGASISSPINRTFVPSQYPLSPATGAPATFTEFVNVMRAGNTYINIYTAACGGGEIRGQIM